MTEHVNLWLHVVEATHEMQASNDSIRSPTTIGRNTIIMPIRRSMGDQDISVLWDVLPLLHHIRARTHEVPVEKLGRPGRPIELLAHDLHLLIDEEGHTLIRNLGHILAASRLTVLQGPVMVAWDEDLISVRLLSQPLNEVPHLVDLTLIGEVSAVN
jgi:hypothetical protein